DDGKTDELGHRRKRELQVPRAGPTMARQNGVGPVVGQKKRVAVGRRTRRVIHGDGAGGAWAAFDDDRLPQRFAELRPDDSRQQVARAAHWKWNDAADRTTRVPRLVARDDSAEKPAGSSQRDQLDASATAGAWVE